MRESILAVGFGLNVSAENYERLHAELPSYQKIFQELTGDWTSNVIFRRFAEPEPVPTDAPPAVEPLIPVSAPNPPADESVYAPEPVDPVDALSEETPIPDAVPEPEEMTAAPAVDVVAAEPPSETTAAVPSQLSGRRHSIINDDFAHLVLYFGSHCITSFSAYNLLLAINLLFVCIIAYISS